MKREAAAPFDTGPTCAQAMDRGIVDVGAMQIGALALETQREVFPRFGQPGVHATDSRAATSVGRFAIGIG